MAFGSLISAVDPVAVLSIFEEVLSKRWPFTQTLQTHVNEQLNMLVFGESVLNDAISIVFYNLFVGLSLVEEALPLWEVIVLAVGKFIYVSLGGVAMGLIWGLIASFITKYTRKIYIIEVLVAGIHLKQKGLTLRQYSHLRTVFLPACRSLSYEWYCCDPCCWHG